MTNNLRPLVSLLVFILSLCCNWVSAQEASSTDALSLETGGYGAPDWLVRAGIADPWTDQLTTSSLKTQLYASRPLFTTGTDRVIGKQPNGALAGKVVYAMAGHGWTYESEKMTYYTQRGLNYGIVEDLGNADQMHIFAHLLFQSGATVVPLRPIDHQPIERIIDNSSAQCILYGTWSPGSSPQYYGTRYDTVPYAVTTASLTETAVARFQPYLPKNGYYPVYGWARDGADRVRQTYRIAHAGGNTEVLVNHKMTGKGWVWLGTYYFAKGSAGYVEVSNRVVDPYEADGKHVAVADAIRFGNGFGDVPRPGGISTFTREDEGDSYWIQRSLGYGADLRLYSGTVDGAATVASPPRTAAYLNRESNGSYFDRLLISFHTNAATGKARGAVALFNASDKQRPTYQESLAELIGREINVQLRESSPLAAIDWADRERHTYNGINFGELRKDYLQNEMAATIVESAFHDNLEDTKFLLDPASRLKITQATLRGVIRWLSENGNVSSAVQLMPDPPVAITAVPDGTRINVSWKDGVVDALRGAPSDTYRVFRSTDGYAFDGGIEVSGTDTTVEALTTAGVTFIRVAAVNGAGESLPSQTIAAGTAGSERARQKQKILVISGNIFPDQSLNMRQVLGGSPNVIYDTDDVTYRVRLIHGLQIPFGAEEALSLAALGYEFSGANAAALSNDFLSLNPGQVVIYDAGFQDADSPLLDEQIQTRLRTFVANGGRLFINGSSIAANSKRHSWGRFSRQIVGISSGESLNVPAPLQSKDNRFFPVDSLLGIGALSDSDNLMHYGFKAERVTPTASISLSLIEYQARDGSNAVAGLLTKPAGARGEVIFFGVEFDKIDSAARRTEIMAAVLKQFQ